MDTMEEQTPNNEEIKRPRSLTILCILTFIFTGLGILSSIITPLTAETMKEFMLSSPGYDEEAMRESLRVIEAGWGYYLTTLFFTFVSLTGAILMWNLKKLGFHFYAFSNLMIMFVPKLFLDITISWYAIFFSLAFISFYAFYLKFMK
ncbi:MAG: hypothetical protein IPP64_10085 [Bacteroidetes bacterium]|nr:hypothetical protein [Bacteroidota bacterium]